MADLQRLEEALINADRAGDTQAATALAGELRRLREAPAQPAQEQGGLWNDVNYAVNRVGTQFAKGITGMLGLPRTVADLGAQGVNLAYRTVTGEDMKPETRAAIGGAARVALPGGSAPSTEQMNDAIFNGLGLLEVDGTTPAGKILDVGLQAVGSGPLVGAKAKAVLPFFAGGAGSEIGGQMAGGTPFELPARVAGGVIGGGVAAGAQHAALKGVEGVRTALRPPPPDTKAGEIVAARLAQDGRTPATAASEVRQLGNDAVLADMDGRNIRGLVKKVGNTPSAGSEKAAQFAYGRNRGQGSRIVDGIEKNLTKDADFFLNEEALMKAQRAAAQQNYAAAYAAGIDPTDEMIALMKRRPMSEAFKRAQRIADAEGATIRPIAKFNDAGDFVGIERGADGRILRLDMQSADYMKRGLDDMVDSAYRSGDKGYATALKELRNQWRNSLKESNPDYAQALEKFAGDAAVREALDRGYTEAFRLHPERIKQAMSDMTASEKQFFRTGAGQAIVDKIAKTGRGRDATAGIAGSDFSKAQIKAIFGDDAEAFIKQVEAEGKKFALSNRVFAGSPTQPLMEEGKDIANRTFGAASDLATGNVGGAVKNVIFDQIMRRLADRARGVNEQTYNSMADILFTPQFYDDPRIMGMLQKQSGNGGLLSNLNAQPMLPPGAPIGLLGVSTSQTPR